jgi:2-iminobutanoate/2-iminopropanoate deaminase
MTPARPTASDNPRMRQVNSDASVQGATYSHAVVDGDRVFLAGQVAADRPEPPPLGDIEVETRACMELIQSVLAELGLTFADVVRVGVFMTDLSEFERMDRVYASFLAPGHAPARTTVGVAQILFGCRVEIDCVARLRTAG